MADFQREDRYVVLKRKDVERLPEEVKYNLEEICTKAEIARALRGKEPLECVVVERDWPIYGTVWKLIEERMS